MHVFGLCDKYGKHFRSLPHDGNLEEAAKSYSSVQNNGGGGESEEDGCVWWVARLASEGAGAAERQKLAELRPGEPATEGAERRGERRVSFRLGHFPSRSAREVGEAQPEALPSLGAELQLQVMSMRTVVRLSEEGAAYVSPHVDVVSRLKAAANATVAMEAVKGLAASVVAPLVGGTGEEDGAVDGAVEGELGYPGHWSTAQDRLPHVTHSLTATALLDR